MQIEKTSEDQVQRLLTTHPGLLGEDAASTQERSHVVHCMQCELQFQVDMAYLSQEDERGKHTEGAMHIRYNQPEKMSKEMRFLPQSNSTCRAKKTNVCLSSGLIEHLGKREVNP